MLVNAGFGIICTRPVGVDFSCEVWKVSCSVIAALHRRNTDCNSSVRTFLSKGQLKNLLTDNHYKLFTDQSEFPTGCTCIPPICQGYFVTHVCAQDYRYIFCYPGSYYLKLLQTVRCNYHALHRFHFIYCGV